MGNCGFFISVEGSLLLTFLWWLLDVLECSATTSCHRGVSNLGLNYFCKLAGCTFNVQPAFLHKKFFQCKAHHVAYELQIMLLGYHKWVGLGIILILQFSTPNIWLLMLWLVHSTLVISPCTESHYMETNSPKCFKF